MEALARTSALAIALALVACEPRQSATAVSSPAASPEPPATVTTKQNPWRAFTPSPKEPHGAHPPSAIGGHEDPVSGGKMILEQGPWVITAGECSETLFIVARGHALIAEQTLDEGDAIAFRSAHPDDLAVTATGRGVALVAYANVCGVDIAPLGGPTFRIARAGDAVDVALGASGTARTTYEDEVLSAVHTRWSGPRRQAEKGLEVLYVVEGGGQLVSADDEARPIDEEFPRALPQVQPIWIESGYTWTLLHERSSTEAYEVFWPPRAATDLAQ
jgi:hypothetical protein